MVTFLKNVIDRYILNGQTSLEITQEKNIIKIIEAEKRVTSYGSKKTLFLLFSIYLKYYSEAGQRVTSIFTDYKQKPPLLIYSE